MAHTNNLMINGVLTPVTMLDSSAQQIDNAVEKVETLTPAMIGAVPIVDARSAAYNMDTIIRSGVHFALYDTDASTLGTPRAQGLTGYSAATILSYAKVADYAIQVAFYAGDNIWMRTCSGGVISNWSVVLNTGNKPSGSYTGNGATRTVDTKGVGSTVLIYSDTEALFGIVGYSGIIRVSSGAITRNNAIHFRNGIITIAGSSSEVMNANGVTYNYQVL